MLVKVAFMATAAALLLCVENAAALPGKADLHEVIAVPREIPNAAGASTNDTAASTRGGDADFGATRDRAQDGTRLNADEDDDDDCDEDDDDVDDQELYYRFRRHRTTGNETLPHLLHHRESDPPPPPVAWQYHAKPPCGENKTANDWWLQAQFAYDADRQHLTSRRARHEYLVHRREGMLHDKWWNERRAAHHEAKLSRIGWEFRRAHHRRHLRMHQLALKDIATLLEQVDADIARFDQGIEECRQQIRWDKWDLDRAQGCLDPEYPRVHQYCRSHLP